MLDNPAMAFITGFIPANGAIEAALTIAVIVIGFIGWLIQIAGQAKTPPPGPGDRPRPGAQRPRVHAAGRPRAKPSDEKLQSEIDAFLRDVSSGRRPLPPEDEVAIEIIPDDDLPDERPRRRLRQSESSLPASQGPRSPRVATSEPMGQVSEWDREHRRRRENLLSTVAERHLESSPLGAELRKHVEETMAESIQLRREKEQAERSLAEARAELSAMRTQGGSKSGVPAGERLGASAKASRFAELLKDAGTVKDAIVISEVLGRPKGAHRRSRS